MKEVVMTDQLVSLVELCREINVTRWQIRTMRRHGMPCYALSPHGGELRFNVSEVKHWMRTNATKNVQASSQL